MNNLINLYQKIFMNEKEIAFSNLLNENTPGIKISKSGSVTVLDNYSDEDLQNVYNRAAKIIENQRI